MNKTRTPEHRRTVALKHEGWAHGHPRTLDIRQGDTVVVLTGKDAGKRGQVVRTIVDTQRIVVQGVNILKRHTKSNVRGNLQGGIVDFEAPIAYSNVMLICPSCDKATRVGYHVNDDGTRVIVCRKCGARNERTHV